MNSRGEIASSFQGWRLTGLGYLSISERGTGSVNDKCSSPDLAPRAPGRRGARPRSLTRPEHRISENSLANPTTNRRSVANQSGPMGDSLLGEGPAFVAQRMQAPGFSRRGAGAAPFDSNPGSQLGRLTSYH